MQDKDIVLLVARSGRQVISPIQLQKAVFLVSRAGLKGLPQQAYDFQAYHYGPFDADVYNDAEKLHTENLVLRAPSRSGAWTDTMITPEGWDKTEALRRDLPHETVEKIDEIVQTVLSMPFRTLLRYVYDKYPEFRKNSVFQY